MSRTDKDRPYWVRVRDKHEKRSESHTHRSWRSREELACDIDQHDAQGYNERHDGHCGYQLDLHKGCRYHSSPPGWLVDHLYHEPMRRDARDVLREAAKEWNGSGDTEREPLSPQNRHDAHWHWC